jgi:hypothetical protein
MAGLLETLFDALGLFLESIGVSRPARKPKPASNPVSGAESGK